MTRRGIALLLVLVVLVVASTAVTGAARLTVASRAHAVVVERARVTEALRIGVEGHIENFLRVRSPLVVLEPGASTPNLVVLDDRLTLRDGSYRVSVTAFDQCGMIPWTCSRSGSPLRAALPARISRLCDVLPGSGPSQGLDTMVIAAREAGLRCFPASAAARLSSEGGPPVALGGLVGTHNPEPPFPGRSPANGGLINVNTAPRALLAAALRGAEVSALDEILSSRAAGRPAPAPATSALGTGSASHAPNTLFRLVAQSDCWAFRVDIETASVRRAWWMVYRATGLEWRCVQRVVINE